MDKDTIIQILKEQYTRDVRKQLIKSILSNEKQNDKDALQQQYKIIGQIFAYVLKECNWSFPTNSTNLDNTPLLIMTNVFPKLDTTKWYKEQLLFSNKKK